MSSREVLRVLQHAAGVYKTSMGARNGYSSVLSSYSPIKSSRGQPPFVHPDSSGSSSPPFTS